ncbi:MAG: TonB-dependent receptor, partial [Gemmatimonadales bacterium]
MIRIGRLGLGILIALVPGGALAQQAAPPRVVRGLVVDAGSGTALPGVRVSTRPGGQRTQSSAEGRFAIAVATGDTLVVRVDGFRPGLHIIAAGDTALRISLASAPAQLAELVVTASRREQRASESAIAVTRISGAEIDAAAAAALDQAIATVPGLAMLPNTPTGANLAIRGIAGPRVLVLIDGEPTVGAMLENRDLSRISTVAADHIEVVKGPMSALYGSDALGGVVNLITRDPAGPLALDGRVHLGSMGRRDAQLSAQAGGPISFRVTGAWREQTQVASATWADDALTRVWDIRATGRVAATPSLAIRTDVNLLRERQRWRVSSDGFNGFNDNIGATGWAEVRWQRDANTLRSRLYVERYEHLFRQARSPRPLAIDTTPAQSEWMAKASLGWSRVLGGQTWDAGIDLSHRAIESPGKVAGVVADDMAEGYLQVGIATG